MAKLGVCMISTKFYPWAGGAEKQAERLGAWLVQRGVPVMLITQHYDDLPRHEIINGIEVYRVRTLKGKAPAALSFIFFGVMTMLAHRKAFNLIHSHQIYSPTTIGWIVSRLMRYPLVVNLHLGGAEGDIQRLMRNPTTGKLRLNILKSDADAFIAISQEIEKELLDQGIPQEKIHFLLNAVDPNIYRPVDADTKTALRQKLGLPLNVPIGVFTGRLVEIKGAELMLKAWQNVPDPAHLVILGTGHLEDKLKAYAAEKLPGRVTFAGKRDNVQEYMQAGDCWTLPSFGEGLPVSLLEAMSCALPVVVTPVGAIPEIIQDGSNGLIVPTGDEQALSKALTRALDCTEATLELGKQARELILQKYSLDAIAQSYHDLFQKVSR